MFTKTLIALAVASAAIARPFTTAPVAATTYTAGETAVVRWQDDGSTPSLEDFGPASISIYVGNSQQQTRLQLLNESVDVSQVSEISFIPDATIGPNSDEYFIRYESLELKDPSQPQFPALAFSAKFTLAGMTGTFSPAVSSQIAGQSTAPLSPTSGTNTRTSTPTNTGTTTTSSPTRSVTTGTSSTPTPTESGAASHRAQAGIVGALLSALVGVALF